MEIYYTLNIQNNSEEELDFNKYELITNRE